MITFPVLFKTLVLDGNSSGNSAMENLEIDSETRSSIKHVLPLVVILHVDRPMVGLWICMAGIEPFGLLMVIFIA